MSKIIRLTEQDLVRLVKRVINEQSTDYKRYVKGIKDGVGSFGNTNEETLFETLSVLSGANIQTINSVYRDLKINSMVEHLDDEFMAYSLLKGQKNDPIGKHIYRWFGGPMADRIMTLAKKLDERYKKGK